MKIQVLEEAIADLAEGFRFYERQHVTTRQQARKVLEHAAHALEAA